MGATTSTPILDAALSRGFYLRNDPNLHMGPPGSLIPSNSPAWQTRCGQPHHKVSGTVTSRDGRALRGRWCLACLRQAGLA